MICVNYHCTSQTCKNHLRCPSCRSEDIYLCTDCGKKILEPKSTRCMNCRIIRRHNMNILSYDKRNNKRRECLICFEYLQKGKTCKGECKRIYANLYMSMYIKEHGVRQV